MSMDPNAANIVDPETDNPAVVDVDNPVDESTEIEGEGNPTTDLNTDELAAGYLRHADYTRKTQMTATERAEARREMEAAQRMKAELQPYREFESELKNDPELFEQVQALMQARGISRKAPVDSELRAEVKAIKDAMAEQRWDSYVEAFEKNAVAVATAHGIGTKDMQAIIAEGLEDKTLGTHIPPANLNRVLTKLVKAHLADNAKAVARGELASTIRQKAKMSSPKASGTIPAAVEVDTSKMTQDERVATMMKLVKQGTK